MKISIIALAAAVMVITGSMAFAATSAQSVSASIPALEMSYNGQGGYGHGGYGHGGHGGHGGHSGICW
ncbi:MAG: hypothetical protein MI749_10755 [Desulfovibrionales bacterium]|nr:hypothetical protein [Desulfovibrionales bacterium]